METKTNLANREGAVAKAVAMSVLFKRGTYEAITNILDQIDPEDIDAKKNAFKVACGNEIDDQEKEWLWNYLKHYNKALAKATDEKWNLHVTGRPHW